MHYCRIAATDIILPLYLGNRERLGNQNKGEKPCSGSFYCPHNSEKNGEGFLLSGNASGNRYLLYTVFCGKIVLGGILEGDSIMDNYFSSIKEMQAQLFHVLAIAASIANLCGFFLNAFLYGNTMPTQICVICGAVIFICSIFGFVTRHKGWAAVGILVTVVWIEFPFLYSVYGDIILVYFVLSILGIIIFFPCKFSTPFCVMTLVLDVLVMVITHILPERTDSIGEAYLLVFAICSYLIVAVAVFVLLNIVILRYERQKQELHLKNVQLDYMATHDALTQIYNRGYLMKEIEKRIQADNTAFIAVIMDIDNFKQLNDTYGHSFGDYVLSTFARIMEKEVGEDGFVARFGGEEFMIIYDHDKQEAALQILHNIATELETYFQKEKQISITFSGGLELYSSKKKIDELIVNADNKLYQAKRNGKNQIIC